MRFFTNRYVFNHRWLSVRGRICTLLAVLTLAAVVPSFAGELPQIDKARVELAMQRLATPEASDEDWMVALSAINNPDAKQQFKIALIKLDSFPRARFYHALTDPRLATRLGALEMLEEYVGSDYGFDPWVLPEDAVNQKALEEWKRWSGESGKLSTKDRSLTDEDYRLYIRELLSPDRNRAERAMRMLEPQGVKAITVLQKFLSSEPTLQQGGVARIRMAQYRLALKSAGNHSAASLASDLTFGNRDQKLNALGTLRGVGFTAIPIIRDFIDAADPLIRETAVDGLFATAGEKTLSLLNDPLMKEKDRNVVMAAIRYLADIKVPESTALLTHFVTMEDEDVVVAAIEALYKGGSDDPFKSSNSSDQRRIKNAQDLAAKWIDDPRWRVRTAALQFIAATGQNKLKNQVIAALDDQDSYVRYSAVRAVGALKIKAALPKLREMVKTDTELFGHVASVVGSLGGGGFDQDFIDELKQQSPDVIQTVMASLRETGGTGYRILFAHLVEHPNEDVSCAALRAFSSNSVDDAKIRAILLKALESGEKSKVIAVVSELNLPRELSRADRRLEKLDAEVQARVSAARPSTALDSLYSDFLTPGGKEPIGPSGGAIMPSSGSANKQEFINRLVELYEGSTDDGIRFPLAVKLLSIGRNEPVAYLLKEVPKRAVNERRDVAWALYNERSLEALPLLELLMNDPVDAVRATACNAAFDEEKELLTIETGLKAIVKPDARLLPADIYGYNLVSCLRQGQSALLIKDWARRLIADENASEPLKVLAIISLRGGLTKKDGALLGELMKHPSQWLRRAAAEAAGYEGSDVFIEAMDKLSNDSSAMVRSAVSEVYNRQTGYRKVYFSANQKAELSDVDYNYKVPNLTEQSMKVLRRMAKHDKDAKCRLEAMLSLLSQQQVIDTKAFIETAGEANDPDLRRRLATFFENNAAAVTPGLQPLLALTDVDKINERIREQLYDKLGLSGSDAFLSFDSLADIGDTSRTATFDKPAKGEVAERTSLAVVFFHKDGCDECARVDVFLAKLKESMPLLDVNKVSILSPEGTLFNQALAARYHVDSGKAPSLFAQAGVLQGEKIEIEQIAKLLGESMSLPQDDQWAKFSEEEKAQAELLVEQSFESLTLATILLAGLADGVNPCAFATIIFFLSYLQVAKRTRREILMVGIAFILAVFLSYFAFGLVLHKIIGEISGLKWARFILDWAFGIMALVLAVLSFRDAAKARKGKLSEMTLQLPGFLKDRIRGAIRHGAKARRFVIAAFVLGVVVSLLELSCTGQVYAPIIYKIQQGNMDALFYLLLYNLAFILPLIVIFVLAFFGMKSDALVRFQQKHTVLVKVLLGLVFLLLAIAVLTTPLKDLIRR